MKPTQKLIAEAKRKLPQDLHGLFLIKYSQQNQKEVSGLLHTSVVTLRSALNDGLANDLLTYRMAKLKIGNLSKDGQKRLIDLTNKHFAEGVNGLEI